MSTYDRVRLRKKVVEFQRSILGDVLFNGIYSVRQPNWYLHARKIPEIFIRKHNGNATEFYFDLIHKLLTLQPLSEETNYRLFLSQRHSNSVQRFTQAFERVLTTDNRDRVIAYNCAVVRSQDFPELSIVDYLLWTLQRYILKGEGRYFAALEHHYEQILDLYEDDGQGRLYMGDDHFTLEKASPFEIEVKK